MKSRPKEQTVELLSLIKAGSKEIHIPKKTTALHDVAKGPVVFEGKLTNDGRIKILGNKSSQVEIVATKFVNNGKLTCESGTLSLATANMENHGTIEVPSRLKVRSTSGKLSLNCEQGSMLASEEIVFDASNGLIISAGIFTSKVIQFSARAGRVSVLADELNGEVEVDAKSASVGTKAGKLNLGERKLLSGDHVYYSVSGSLSLGNISHGSDAVTLLAGGSISVGSITAGNLTIGAGVNFTIGGQYPNPTQDSDANVSWEITSPYGYQPLAITGAINVSGNATIKAWTVETDDITVAGDLEIETSSENGEVTISGDLDVDGATTILAYQIDFEGESFDVAGVLELGNSSDVGYINLAGTFTASDDVTFNSYYVIFDCDDITMNGSGKEFLTAANLRVEASGTIAIDSDVSTNRSVNLLFYSDGNVKTGSITVDNSLGTSAGAVVIKANRTGGSTEFIIGGSSNNNGVNGQIVTDTVNGGATEEDSFSHGSVYIANSGDGGITLTNATDISVKGTSSKSGGITLDADDGTISLPTGTLSAEGTGTYAGSFIQLLADTLETADGTIISASDSGDSGKQKLVQIAVNTITLTGSAGLMIKADGDGNSTYLNNLSILPKGAVTLADNDYAPYFLYWYILETGTYEGAGGIEFDGAGTAPLSISCNGSHSELYISGYPVIFNTGETSLECKGAENHSINILRFSASGSDGLQFNGGNVTIDASGPDSDDGDGGDILIGIDKILRTEDGNVTIKADGKDSGNGGQIEFYPYATDIVVGMDDEQFAFSAKGGATDGDGGKVNLYGWNASIEVQGAGEMSTPIDVSAPGADGNGGEIQIVAYGSSGLVFDGTVSYLKADSGSSSGNGGKITILASNAPIKVGTGSSGDVSLSAISNGDGDGGIIDVTSWAGITADSAHVDVTADGDGTGGTIKLNAGYSTFTLNGGELHADGGDAGGNGGLIHLEGGQIVLPGSENTLLAANGQEGGDGGTIEVITQWASVDFGNGNGQVLVEAKGSESASLRMLASGSGKGGSIEVIQQKSFEVSAETGFVVSAFNDGDGGAIVIQCTEFVDVDGAMNADGTGAGEGGTISIEAPIINLGEEATFSAEAGVSSDSNGGVIALRNGEGTEIDLSERTALMFTAKGYGEGEGGRVTIEKVGQFSLHALINVDGGSDASTTDPFGTIALNGVVCVQWKTGWEDWPQTYWKSVLPNTEPDNVIATHAHGMDDDVRAALDNFPIHIYYMDHGNEFNTFFATSSPHQSDLTHGGYSIPVLGVSAVYARMDLGSGLQTVESATGKATIKKASIAHECGHNMDVIWSFASGGTGTGSYGEAKNTDYTTNSPGYINYESCSTVLGTTVCGAYTGSNSEILEQWVTNNYELFAHIFQTVIYPNTSLTQLETALLYLPETKTWMQNKINSI